MYYPRFTKLVVNFVMEKDPSIPRRNKVNWHYARDDPMFTTINVISRNEATQLYGAILPVALTNEDIRNSESYKEYYARASGTIPPKTKGSKKKANTDIITQQKPPTAPKEKKSGKGKQKTTELENISEADLTEAEQLKIITKRSRQETHSSHASGSGADEGTGVTPGVPDAPDYDSEDDISWKSSDDDQDDEQAQDDEDAGKNDVNETTQDDEDDDDHDDDETVQEDDDEEQTESDDDGDDFVHMMVDEGKTDKIYSERDQGNEAVKDTKPELDGRDKRWADDDENPRGTDGGPIEEGQERNPLLPVLHVTRKTKTAGTVLPVRIGLTKSFFCISSQSAPVGVLCTLQLTLKVETRVETGVKYEQAEEEFNILQTGFIKLRDYLSPDHAWNTLFLQFMNPSNRGLANLATTDPGDVNE
ncbi:hypothetical protein Tco_1026569 [Tanacetum coccineum]